MNWRIAASHESVLRVAWVPAEFVPPAGYELTRIAAAPSRCEGRSDLRACLALDRVGLCGLYDDARPFFEEWDFPPS